MSKSRIPETKLPEIQRSSSSFREPLWVWASVGIIAPSLVFCFVFALWRRTIYADDGFFENPAMFLLLNYFIGVVLVAIPSLIWISRHRLDAGIRRIELFGHVVSYCCMAAFLTPIFSSILISGNMGLIVDPAWIAFGIASLVFGSVLYVPSAFLFSLIVMQRS